MSLTNSQLLVLKADIAADPVLDSQPNNSDGAFEISRLYALQAEPAFTVWRSAVTLTEIMSNGFRWTDVDGLTAAKYRTWECFLSLGTINPSRANVRQGLRDCWGAGSQQELAILVHLKRLANRAEKLFATGTGSDAQPATMAFEGVLTLGDIERARNL